MLDRLIIYNGGNIFGKKLIPLIVDNVQNVKMTVYIIILMISHNDKYTSYKCAR